MSRLCCVPCHLHDLYHVYGEWGWSNRCYVTHIHDISTFVQKDELPLITSCQLSSSLLCVTLHLALRHKWVHSRKVQRKLILCYYIFAGALVSFVLTLDHPLGYERVYLPLCQVAYTPFYIQGDDIYWRRVNTLSAVRSDPTATCYNATSLIIPGDRLVLSFQNS